MFGRTQMRSIGTSAKSRRSKRKLCTLSRHRREQWPRFQTEIHFYPSNEVHRRIAKQIVAHYEI